MELRTVTKSYSVIYLGMSKEAPRQVLSAAGWRLVGACASMVTRGYANPQALVPEQPIFKDAPMRGNKIRKVTLFRRRPQR